MTCSLKLHVGFRVIFFFFNLWANSIQAVISTLLWALSHGHICTISLLIMPLVIFITLTYWTNGTSRTMPNYTASSLLTLICLFLHSTASSTWKSFLCSCVSRIKLLPFLQRFSTFSMMLITSLAIGFIE